MASKNQTVWILNTSEIGGGGGHYNTKHFENRIYNGSVLKLSVNSKSQNYGPDQSKTQPFE